MGRATATVTTCIAEVGEDSGVACGEIASEALFCVASRSSGISGSSSMSNSGGIRKLGIKGCLGSGSSNQH